MGKLHSTCVQGPHRGVQEHPDAVPHARLEPSFILVASVEPRAVLGVARALPRVLALAVE